MIYNMHKRGFTLIETLVAVLLLVTSVAGPLTIAARSLLAAAAAKEQITAFYLAQDAIEFVRYARDTNQLKGSTVNWIDGGGTGISLNACVTTVNAAGCRFDSTQGAAPVGCGATACPVMQYSTSLYRYVYSGGVATPFTRTVTISASPATERTVTATVSWRGSGGNTRQVVIEEHIFDWQP